MGSDFAPLVQALLALALATASTIRKPLIPLPRRLRRVRRALCCRSSKPADGKRPD